MSEEQPNGDEEVPEELKDEKGYTKIGVAIAVSAVIIGGTAAALAGVIPAESPITQQIVTLFVAFAGAVGFFLFKKYSK